MDNFLKAVTGLFLLTLCFVCSDCVTVGPAINDTVNRGATTGESSDGLFSCEIYQLLVRAKRQYLIALDAIGLWIDDTKVLPSLLVKALLAMVNIQPCNQTANESLVAATLNVYRAMNHRVSAGLWLINATIQRSQEYEQISSALRRLQRDSTGSSGLQAIVNTLERVTKANKRKSNRKKNTKAVRKCSVTTTKPVLQCLYSVFKQDAINAAAIQKVFRKHVSKCRIPFDKVPCWKVAKY